jgi:hypothetical protein
LSRAVVVTVAAWAAAALAGWLAESVALTVLAPLLLVPLPVLLVRARDGQRWRELDPFEPVWLVSLVYAFTYLAVPALYALEPRDFSSLPGYLDAPPDAWLVAAWLGGLGFLGFLAGYFGPAGLVVARRLPRATLAGEGIVGYLAAALFAAGVASVLVAIYVNDGFSEPLPDLLTGSLREETVSSFSGRGYLTLGFALLSLSVPCAAWWAGERDGWRPWLLVAGAGVVAGVLLAGVVGSRLLALGALLATIVVVHYRIRPLSWRTIVPAGAVLVLAGVVIADLRGTGSADDPIAALGTLSLTLDGFSFLVNTVARTQELLWGATLVEDTTLTYLPRAIWDGKPVVYGAIAAQEAVVPGLYQGLGRSSTYPVGMVAEGYLNFGVVGAVLLPAAIGVGLRALYLRLLELRDPFYVLLMAWVLANVVTLFRGVGGLIPQLLVTAFALSPLLLATWVRARRRIAAAR